jgi:hypothetical protein
MGPTGHNAYDSDYSQIKAYDTVTGKLTLEKALSFYHYGAAASTATKYPAGNGQALDIRQEVVYLSRSVTIRGDTSDLNADWGGQMVISDTTLSSGKTKAGTLTMDNVCMTKVG